MCANQYVCAMQLVGNEWIWRNRFLVDNYYIRTLLGTRKYFSHSDVTENDLEIAKKRLLKFKWYACDTLKSSLSEVSPRP